MAPTLKVQIPPLGFGDRLTPDEFLRRWEAHPEIKYAELIGGMVFMPSPVSVEHGETDNDVGGWLCLYKAATPGTAAGNNTTSYLLDDVPQPGTYLRILPACGGGSWVEDRFLHGIPELLAEVSLSRASYDLHVKLNLYQASKVPEYLAIVLYEQEIRWHVLVEDQYQLLTPDPDGVHRSRVFPGLWLDGAALLKGNMGQVLVKLQEGLNSPEHRAFVAELGRRRDQRSIDDAKDSR